MPNEDQVKGKWDQAKGTVKETIGKATGDRDMESSGQTDQVKGNIREGYGNVKEGVKDIGDAADAATRP